MPERDRRRHDRIPLALEVSYRTTGNFLVAYTLNLSKGGLFVETDAPLPEGTPLTLQLRVPGMDRPVTLSGRVAWVRWRAEGGQPPGMGVAFQDVEARVGALIDALVTKFGGISILYLGKDRGIQGIDRRIESLFNCSMRRVQDAEEAKRLLARESFDLVVLDMDSHALESLDLLRHLQGEQTPAVPVMAVASLPADIDVARAYGADECIQPSVSSPGLKSALLECLSRPITRRLDEDLGEDAGQSDDEPRGT